MKEETGLDFTPINAGHMYEKPAFTSIGFSDEAVATVFGYADGEISEEFQEMSEEIQVVRNSWNCATPPPCGATRCWPCSR